MPANKKPWGGRFDEATNPAVERFSASVHFDRALARYDIRGSIAHVRMLGRSGIVSDADVETLVSGLADIQTELEA
ncbi:MAG: argininosuccinate lyase, partial [Myxococcota bacterium]